MLDYSGERAYLSKMGPLPLLPPTGFFSRLKKQHRKGSRLNVLNFNSPEEMRAYLIQAQADAHNSLHAAQRALTYGDYWVRFVDIAEKHIEFGRISTLDEVADQEMNLGATRREVQQVIQATDASLRNNYMYGKAYSRYNREGEYGHTHKAHVWPIEETLFFQAAEANWQIDLLPASGKINLNAAFLAMRGHVRGE